MGPQAQSQHEVVLAHISSYTALGKLGTFRIISSAHEIRNLTTASKGRLRQ